MQAPRSTRFALVWVDPSGGPLDLWPTRPFALNPPLSRVFQYAYHKPMFSWFVKGIWQSKFTWPFIKLIKRNIPVQILHLLENMIFVCHTHSGRIFYVLPLWRINVLIFSRHFQSYVRRSPGLRSGAILFANYLYNLCETCSFAGGRFIILYADDIVLISPSVVDLEKNWLISVNHNYNKTFSGDRL